jgi:hypothetical protein
MFDYFVKRSLVAKINAMPMETRREQMRYMVLATPGKSDEYFNIMQDAYNRKKMTAQERRERIKKMEELGKHLHEYAEYMGMQKMIDVLQPRIDITIKLLK